MRNRSNTPSRSENDFIHGGTAGIDKSDNKNKIAKKAKPVSISFLKII